MYVTAAAGDGSCAAGLCLTRDRGESRGRSLPPPPGPFRAQEEQTALLVCGCYSATLAGDIKESSVPCRCPSPCDGRSRSLAVSGGDCLIRLACSHRGTRSHAQCGPCAPRGICQYLLVACLLLLLSWLLLQRAQPRGRRLICIQRQALLAGGCTSRAPGPAPSTPLPADPSGSHGSPGSEALPAAPSASSLPWEGRGAAPGMWLAWGEGRTELEGAPAERCSAGVHAGS